MTPLLQVLTVLSTLLTLATVPTTVLAQGSDGPSPYGSYFGPDVTVDITDRNAPITQLTEGALVTGLELDNNGTLDENTTLESSQVSGEKKRASNFYLRIMPLGASITQGAKSTDNNGYRKHIRDQLRYEGWLVNMVGSLQDGTMADKVRFYPSYRRQHN